MTSEILDRGMTEAEMREKVLRDDRAQWFPAQHGSGSFGILSRKGREVARCEQEQDRDFILRAARAHHELVDALEEALQFAVHESEMRGEFDTLYAVQSEPLISKIGAALVKARAT